MAASKRPRRSPYKPKKAPTARQRAYLAAVVELTAQLGKPPNAQEIGDHMGLTRHGARLVLKLLQRAGYLRDVPKVVSSGKWALTPDGQAALEE